MTRASSSSRARRASSSSLETLGGTADVLVPLTLVGTVPGGALDDPAKDAAEGAVGLDETLFPDLGADGTLEPEVGPEGARGLELAVGEVDLLTGIPKRCMADSAVSLGGEAVFVLTAGADLAEDIEGRLLILAVADTLGAFPLRGAAAVVGVLDGDGKSLGDGRAEVLCE